VADFTSDLMWTIQPACYLFFPVGSLAVPTKKAPAPTAAPTTTPPANATEPEGTTTPPPAQKVYNTRSRQKKDKGD
jgi:hypothetical protein